MHVHVHAGFGYAGCLLGQICTIKALHYLKNNNTLFLSIINNTCDIIHVLLQDREVANSFTTFIRCNALYVSEDARMKTLVSLKK